MNGQASHYRAAEQQLQVARDHWGNALVCLIQVKEINDSAAAGKAAMAICWDENSLDQIDYASSLVGISIRLDIHISICIVPKYRQGAARFSSPLDCLKNQTISGLRVLLQLMLHCNDIQAAHLAAVDSPSGGDSGVPGRMVHVN